jgi:hypothetical protein
MERKFRIVSIGPGDPDERWYTAQDDLAADVAARLAIPVAEVPARRVAVTLDPVVVLHDGSRWRSRAAWHYRPAAAAAAPAPGAARVHEMIRIDEAQYDH